MVDAPVIAHVLSVNVGTPREIEWLGQTVRTAIWKVPMEGRLAVRGVNVAGDEQADLENHGGVDQALYCYAWEDTTWWESQLGKPLEYGNFGENLTLQGVDITGALIGERWAIGTAVFEVSQPRVPCFKLGARMGDPHFPPRFAKAGRPGAYLRILQEGEVGADDPVEILHHPTHGVTVGDVHHVYHHAHDRAELLLQVPELSPGWQAWARKVIESRRNQ
jgi:MOSC domain-containing protein YiiM